MINATSEEIELFINRFKDHNSSYEELFLYQNCYYFAKILSERFDSGVIMYDRSCQHFLYSKDGLLYDITGNVTEEHDAKDLISLDELETTDPEEYNMIRSICILLT